MHWHNVGYICVEHNDSDRVATDEIVMRQRSSSQLCTSLREHAHRRQGIGVKGDEDCSLSRESTSKVVYRTPVLY